RVVLAKAGPEEGRNNALNEAAFNLGQLVGGGLLREEEGVEALREAACRAGLDVDPNCGPRGIAATIRSGLTVGKDGPRPGPTGGAERNGAAPHTHPQETVPPPSANRGPVIYRLTDLLALNLPPPAWAVEGILSEGLSILAGKPKLGKSWAAL